MRMPSIDFSRPDFMFGICWGLVLLLNWAVPLMLSVEPDETVMLLIESNIASFFVIYFLVKLLTPRRIPGVGVDEVQPGTWDFQVLHQFLKHMLLGWASLYWLTIVYSGGLPIMWLVTNPSKDYGDFGVPTLTGLLNMVRAFVLCGYFLLYLQSRRRTYLWVPAFLLFTGLCEISRGALMVMLCQVLGTVFLRRNISIMGVVKLLVFSALVVLGFGALGDLRGTPLDAEGITDNELLLNAPTGVLFALSYLVTPLTNLFYGAATLHPSYTPYFTLSTILPTVLRSVIFPDIGYTSGTYPIELLNEGFNATSFYSPLAADFGWLGAGIVTVGLQFICCWVHLRAKRGSLYYTLIYPPLFMSVMMSVFYMYFFSLVTVCYPLLGGLYLRYRNARLLRQAQLQQASSSPPVAAPPAPATA